MIKLKSLLKEGALWDRKFGEPLPTLKGIMEKHGDCGCGGTTSCSCESVTEDVKDVVKAKKLGLQLGNVEGRLRKLMYDFHFLEEFLRK